MIWLYERFKENNQVIEKYKIKMKLKLNYKNLKKKIFKSINEYVIKFQEIIF